MCYIDNLVQSVGVNFDVIYPTLVRLCNYYCNSEGVEVENILYSKNIYKEFFKSKPKQLDPLDSFKSNDSINI